MLRLQVGTEHGVIINGNRKGKTEADKLSTTYEGHHGPVYSVKRNPFFPKFFMSVGDWTARVWCEDIREVRPRPVTVAIQPHRMLLSRRCSGPSTTPAT